MNTKLVYVVVSTDTDYYLENAWVSAYSAKYFNTGVQVFFVTDKETYNYIINRKENIKKVVDKFITVDLPTDLNNMQRSRFIKTSLINYIEDDFLYVDTDTVICDSLSDIDNILIDKDFYIGAVNDRHTFMTTRNREQSLTAASKTMGFCLTERDSIYFNGGVILVKNNFASRRFYKEWHNNWKIGLQKGISFDQASLALTNQRLNYPIKLLPGIWNCQILTNALKYLVDAKIIHYFATNSITQKPYWFANMENYENLKQSGKLDSTMLEHIAFPKKAFVDTNGIVSGEEMELQRGSLHYLMAECPPLYNLLKRSANYLMSIYCFYKRLQKTKLPWLF